MKIRNPETGQMEEVYVKAVGSQVLNKKNNSTENTYSCDYINKVTDSKFKVLWTNPSPQSNFNSQNVTLSSNDYDYLIFNYRNNESDGMSVIVKKGQNAKLIYNAYDSGQLLYERTAKYVNDTTYQFLDAKFNGAVRNWLCVPIEIIAVKL